MHRRSILIWLIVGFSTAIFSFFLTTNVANTNWQISLSISLLLILIIEVAFAIYQFKLMYEQFLVNGAFFKAFSSTDRFHELALLYIVRYSGNLGSTFIHVNIEDAIEFWRECIIRAKTSWRVINYASPVDTYDVMIEKKVPFYIEEERIHSRCAIERIFLADSTEELNVLKPVLEAQKGVGIKVFGILVEDISKDILKRINKLRSYDFAVVDERWVYFTELNNKRRIVGGSATCEESILKEASYIFKEVLYQAKKKSRINLA